MVSVDLMQGDARADQYPLHVLPLAISRHLGGARSERLDDDEEGAHVCLMLPRQPTVRFDAQTLVVGSGEAVQLARVPWMNALQTNLKKTY